jgi:hypothetical protein
LLFVDGAADFNILNCPKLRCFFLENFEGMRVMYFKAFKKEIEKDIHPLKTINNFYFDLGEVNNKINKINKTNSNLIDIIRQFINFDPFYRSFNEFESAAFFYKNEKKVKLALLGSKIHPYMHYNIPTNSGDIQFFASNKYWYSKQNDLQDNCDITIDLI